MELPNNPKNKEFCSYIDLNCLCPKQEYIFIDICFMTKGRYSEL